MGPEDEIYGWLWDGQSIDGINEFATRRNLDLIELVETYFPEGWPASVPGDRQGVIKGSIERGTSSGQYGRKGYQHQMQILAIDAQGVALVQTGAICIDTGAEGYEVIETTLDGALEMADQYMSVAETAKVSSPSMRM